MTLKLIFLNLFIVLMIASCKKDTPKCYSTFLKQKSKNKICTTDCPGVTGCDGKFYCNECEANRQGIKIK